MVSNLVEYWVYTPDIYQLRANTITGSTTLDQWLYICQVTHIIMMIDVNLANYRSTERKGQPSAQNSCQCRVSEKGLLYIVLPYIVRGCFRDSNM